MANDRITQDEFLKGVQKQRSLMRKLLASEKRRSEVLTDLALQRFGWMKGKFFETREEWRGLNKEMMFCIKDFKANAKNVYNDEVVVRMICTTVNALGDIETRTIDRMVCYDGTVRFNPEDDIEKELAPLWVEWEAVDERMQKLYEMMRRRYGLTYDRLTLALDKIASLQAALAAKDEAHRAEMKGMIRWNGKIESHLHERLCKDYEQADRMVVLASHSDKPFKEGGAIDAKRSADSMIKWIKKELGV